MADDDLELPQEVIEDTPELLGELPAVKRFRHSAGFGRRIEFWVIGRMLREGLDVYVPLVDDIGIDAIVRRTDGTFAEVQIKARSRDVIDRDAALFAAIVHPEVRPNYWFVFYSERLDKTWLMTSEEFVAHAVQNKSGKNVGKRSIWFNGSRGGREYAKERYDTYLASDFRRITGSNDGKAHSS